MRHETGANGVSICREFIFNYDQSGVSGFRHNDQTYYYYYVKNLQGDIVEIRNQYGTLVGKYIYDAWGNHTITVDVDGIATLNPFRYRGYYYDVETGLYYVKSRYYDPVVGRFISPDIEDILTATPMELTDKNFYAYCDNNPVTRVDIGGEFWNFVVGAVVGAVVSATVTIVASVATGQEINWASVAINAATGALSGAIAASGLGVLAQVSLTCVVSGAGNFSDQVVTKGFDNVAMGEVVDSALLGGATSLVGSAVGNLASGNLNKAGTAVLNQGRDKLLTGVVRESAGQSHSSLIRQGSKYVAQGTKIINIAKAISSSVGSVVGGVVTGVYNEFRYRRLE